MKILIFIPWNFLESQRQGNKRLLLQKKNHLSSSQNDLVAQGNLMDNGQFALVPSLGFFSASGRKTSAQLAVCSQ